VEIPSEPRQTNKKKGEKIGGAKVKRDKDD